MEQKIATSIEQSEKLLELGLSSNTADMYYYKHYPITQIPKVLDGKLCAVDIPAWSLSALLELMPASFIYNDTELFINIFKGYNDNYWYIQYVYKDDSIYKEIYDEYPLDAVFEMVCWLLEQGFIKKGGEK